MQIGWFDLFVKGFGSYIFGVCNLSLILRSVIRARGKGFVICVGCSLLVKVGVVVGDVVVGCCRWLVMISGPARRRRLLF